MIKPIRAEGYDTDKALHSHYLRNYENWFEQLWDKPVVLLEIGIHRGGSLLLWRDYFPRGTIVGLDINPATLEDPSGRILTYCGRQEDVDLLDRIAADTAPNGFDIVIDDGAHVGEMAKTTFWHVFERHLKPGGLYVIEDWGTGYWEKWHDGAAYKFSSPPPSPGSPPLWRRLLPSRRRARRKRPWPNHSHGMVGFVKQLVDECGMGDITLPDWGQGPPRKSKIRRLHISHGHVLVERATDAP